MAKIVGSRGPVDMDLKSMGGSFKAIKAQCDRQGSEPAKRGPKAGKSALSSSSAKNPMGYKRGGAVASGAPKTKDDGIQQLRCGGKAGMKDGRQKAEVGGVMGDPYVGGGGAQVGRPGATRAAARRLGAASKNLNPQAQAVLQNRLAKMTATGTTQPALKKFNSLVQRKSAQGAADGQSDRKAELVAGRDERRAAKIAEKQQTGGPGQRDPNGQMGPGNNTNRRTPQEPIGQFPPSRGGKFGVAPQPAGRLRGPTRPGISPRIAQPSPGGITPLPQGETTQGGDTLDRTMQKRGGKVKPKGR